jgi:hypothetical protein
MNMMVLQNCMDLLKDEPGFCLQKCVIYSNNGKKVIGIKVTDVTNVTGQQYQESVTTPLIGTVPEVSCMSVCWMLCIFYKYAELPTSIFVFLHRTV